jgi:hypothetical protein
LIITIAAFIVNLFLFGILYLKTFFQLGIIEFYNAFMERKMVTKRIFYYRIDTGRHRFRDKKKYQLLETACDFTRVLGGFARLRDLKKFVKTHYPASELKELPRGQLIGDNEPPVEVDHVYLPLEGKAVRKLSWGMSRKKAARIEQIEGGQHLLIKNETKHGFAVTIQLGFDEWANCGLEYIAYSSTEPAFLTAMEKELNQSYGTAECVVDYHGLDRLLQENKITDEDMLIRYIKDPESHTFNHFVGTLPGLTFRSAQQWSKDRTACLIYTQCSDCRGERNRHNRPHVVEYRPNVLFDFYQKQFAALYLPASN